MKLSPADEAYYRFLKQQVDRAQDDVFKADANRRAKIDLQVTRKELKDFVAKKRQEGFNI